MNRRFWGNWRRSFRHHGGNPTRGLVHSDRLCLRATQGGGHDGQHDRVGSIVGRHHGNDPGIPGARELIRLLARDEHDALGALERQWQPVKAGFVDDEYTALVRIGGVHAQDLPRSVPRQSFAQTGRVSWVGNRKLNRLHHHGQKRPLVSSVGRRYTSS